MYLRRLVKSGLASHVVAIPKAFIDDNKLTSGDTLSIERVGKAALNIRLAPTGQEHPREKRLMVSITMAGRPMRHTERDIIAAYIGNPDEIAITLDNPSQAKEIKQRIGQLLALEVVQEDKKRVIAKDFLNYHDTDVDRTMRRIEHIIHSMLDDVKTVDRMPEMAPILMERDKEVNRLGFLIMRIVNGVSTDAELAVRLGLDTRKTIRLWSVNGHLEKIGDEIKRMGVRIATLRSQEGMRRFHALLDEITALYLKLFVAIHANDKLGLDRCLDKREDILHQMDRTEAADRLPHPDLATHLSQILSHIADIGRAYRYLPD